jgi:hypothetical protein
VRAECAQQLRLPRLPAPARVACAEALSAPPPRGHAHAQPSARPAAEPRGGVRGRAPAALGVRPWGYSRQYRRWRRHAELVRAPGHMRICAHITAWRLTAGEPGASARAGAAVGLAAHALSASSSAAPTGSAAHPLARRRRCARRRSGGARGRARRAVRTAPRATRRRSGRSCRRCRPTTAPPCCTDTVLTSTLRYRSRTDTVLTSTLRYRSRARACRPTTAAPLVAWPPPCGRTHIPRSGSAATETAASADPERTAASAVL